VGLVSCSLSFPPPPKNGPSGITGRPPPFFSLLGYGASGPRWHEPSLSFASNIGRLPSFGGSHLLLRTNRRPTTLYPPFLFFFSFFSPRERDGQPRVSSYFFFPFFFPQDGRSTPSPSSPGRKGANLTFFSPLLRSGSPGFSLFFLGIESRQVTLFRVPPFLSTQHSAINGTSPRFLAFHLKKNLAFLFWER